MLYFKTPTQSEKAVLFIAKLYLIFTYKHSHKGSKGYAPPIGYFVLEKDDNKSALYNSLRHFIKTPVFPND